MSIPGPWMPATAQTLWFLSRPLEFLEHLRARHGDVYRIETLLFQEEFILSNPDDIKAVFTGDPGVFHAGEANAPLEPLLGARSVLLLDDKEHLRHRRLLLPPFHGERMLDYADTMRRAAEDDIGGWPRDRSFVLHPHMQRITIDIILRAILGAEDPADVVPLRKALSRVLDRISSPINTLGTIPLLRYQLGGFSPWATFQRDVRYADSLLYQRIERRRSEGDREDVLSLLLSARDDEGNGLTDHELRDELMTLLVAGHETTATMLCWVFDMLLTHPAAYERLSAEVREGPEDPSKLPFLDAVIKEALRMRPVIPAVGRKLTAPITLRGRSFEKGALLVPSAYLVHHDPAIYEDPKTFRPERFLDRKSDPYTWFPFGGGVRRCLGMAFALYEMKVVIATVLKHVRLKKVRAGMSPVRVRVFTFAPEHGVEVTLEG